MRMATTSKSPKKVLLVAHEAARRTIPPYAHRFAPKKFTHWQLFACLVLKAHQQQDYRGVWQLLLDSAELRQAIGLSKVPHWTTIQKAAERLLKAPRVESLLETTRGTCPVGPTSRQSGSCGGPFCGGPASGPLGTHLPGPWLPNRAAAGCSGRRGKNDRAVCDKVKFPRRFLDIRFCASQASSSAARSIGSPERTPRRSPLSTNIPQSEAA